MEKEAGERRFRARRDDGASLVEFALVMPILAMMLFGIVQFGLAYDLKQSVNSASREGARLASLPDSTQAEIIDKATEAYSNAATADPSTLTVEIMFADTPTADDPPCAAHEGEPVQVLVSTPFDLSIPFVASRTLTIESKGEFRCEAAS